jgi:hypothetical protein
MASCAPAVPESVTSHKTFGVDILEAEEGFATGAASVAFWGGLSGIILTEQGRTSFTSSSPPLSATSLLVDRPCGSTTTTAPRAWLPSLPRILLPHRRNGLTGSNWYTGPHALDNSCSHLPSPSPYPLTVATLQSLSSQSLVTTPRRSQISKNFDKFPKDCKFQIIMASYCPAARRCWQPPPWLAAYAPALLFLHLAVLATALLAVI